jgi:hypothetical protein
VRKSLIPIALCLLAETAHANVGTLLTGTFTNEEQVYFETQAKRPAPKWLSLKITQLDDVLTIEEPDAFGTVQAKPHTATIRQDGNLTILDYGQCQHVYRAKADMLVADGTKGKCSTSTAITAITPFSMTLAFADGRTTELRRARPVDCWVAILKDKPKADGSDDWYFERGVELHDQGGRARVGGKDTGAPPVIIRVRNVTWEKNSTNKPAATLYVHKPDKPDRAEAYSWAAPDSARLGINLRWMQTGCSMGS